MRRALLAVVLALGLLPGVAHAACDPSPGSGVMGACAAHPLTSPLHIDTVQGNLGVDVSEFQPNINWADAKAHGLTFAIPRAADGAGHLDALFAINWAQLRALGIPHGAYLFLRPGDCAAEGRVLVARVLAVGGMDALALPPVGDAEVPLPAGCVSAFVDAVKAGLHLRQVIVYTGPGTWPSNQTSAGSLLWVATFGGAPGCVTAWACASGHPLSIAWQYSDSHWGPFPHGWPGVTGAAGQATQVDEDISTGLLKLLPAHRQLERDAARRAHLVALRRRHACQLAVPRPARYRGTCRVWGRELAAIDRKIAKETAR